MKILVNSINHSPDLTGIGKYTGEMVKWLVEQGYDVKVVTAPPYYPQWKVLTGYSPWRYKRELLDGAIVVRCPLWVPKRLSGIKRIIHLASFAIAAFPVMLYQGLIWRPDVVFVVEPPIACVPGALISGWLAGAKKWLHIQDFEVDAAFDLGILKSKHLRRLILYVESFLMRRFDMVSSISVNMVAKLRSKGVAEENALLFENWVDTEAIYPIDDIMAEDLGLPGDKYIVLYSGNMGEKQGLDILIEAARRLQNRSDICFVLCGDGSSRNKLERMSAELQNVLFLPLQPLCKLNALLATARLHVLPQQADVEDLVMPSKLTNMMASGRPVVACAKPGTQVAKVLQNCGIVVDPGDLDAMVEAIVKLVDEDQLTIKMGFAAREYVVKNWERRSVLDKVFGAVHF